MLLYELSFNQKENQNHYCFVWDKTGIERKQFWLGIGYEKGITYWKAGSMENRVSERKQVWHL